MVRSISAASIIAVMAFYSSFSVAQETGDAKFQFPASPAAWINSAPITTEMLAGKAAFLWYFEEDCPRCRERWPEMFEAAKKFEGKPIVFIAVNSGNPRAEVEQYAREVALRWPVIVDPDRSFEKASDVNEITLQNIYQGQLLMPDGTLTRASFDIAESAPLALAQAKWRVEPTDVPETLKPAWLQVEFGNFAGAAAQLKKSSVAVMPDVKAGAEKLLAAVQTELDKSAASAKQSLAGGNKWPAYKAYAQLTTRFKGYDLPADVPTTLKELAADEAVRNELAAGKLWETAQRQAGPAALTTLKRLTKQYPGTDAAAAAERRLSAP